MKTSFIEALIQILGNAKTVNSLLSEQLTYIHDSKAVFVRRLGPIEHIKLLRLQSLIQAEEERCEIPDSEEIAREVMVYRNSYDAAVNNLCTIQEDSVARMIMIKQLMVEVVRDLIPAEINYFRVEYFVGRDRKLYRRPIIR